MRLYPEMTLRAMQQVSDTSTALHRTPGAQLAMISLTEISRGKQKTIRYTKRHSVSSMPFHRAYPSLYKAGFSLKLMKGVTMKQAIAMMLCWQNALSGGVSLLGAEAAGMRRIWRRNEGVLPSIGAPIPDSNTGSWKG